VNVQLRTSIGTTFRTIFSKIQDDRLRLYNTPHFAQMASTVAYDIVLPQGCAAAMKGNLFAGLSACYREFVQAYSEESRCKGCIV